MPLNCNINSQGRIVRLIFGLGTLIIALIVAAFWAWHSAAAWPWIACCVLTLTGAFAIFEATAGWCALRALGFRTKL